MPGKFELKKAKNGQYMFNLKSGNGEIILSSELYTAKTSAVRGIESVQKNASDLGRFDRRKNRGGKEYFVLKAGNGKVIGKSEFYSGTSARDNGIKSVKTNGPKAKIVDLT